MKKTGTILLLTLALVLPSPVLSESGKKKKPKKDVEAIGERNVGKGINLYSIEKEIGLGKQLAADVERQTKIVTDPVVAEFVNRVGQNLVRHSDSKLPFTFKVVESPQVNAFALPGGFCFVHSGLILEAETEAEMAGVLAHEIAHVAARHGTRQASRGQIANLATIPLIIATGGWAGYGIQQAANIAIPVAFLQFSRAFEREADYLGLQYLYASGYDPTAFVDFFEKLASMKKTRPGALAGVFSSHPMTDDRIMAAQIEMQEILPSKPEYLVTTSEFLKVKERLTALLSPAKASEKLDDRPRVRRSGRAGVIRPGQQEPSEEEQDEPPVLRRQGGDEDEPPVIRRQGGDEDERPVMRRQDEQDAPPVLQRQEEQDQRPVLKRPDEDEDERPVLRRQP